MLLQYYAGTKKPKKLAIQPLKPLCQPLVDAHNNTQSQVVPDVGVRRTR